MTWKWSLVGFTLSLLPIGWIQPIELHAPNPQSARVLSFDEKLETKIPRFDTQGRTLLASVLDLAFEYELPVGIEYLDHEATGSPINLDLRDQSVHDILVAVIAQVPRYRVSFSEGVVDVYAPGEREDPSNFLNKVIKSFAVTDLDTHDADLQLLCELAREVGPPGACGGSVALGQWGATKVSIHMHNARVYEILNAITAQNGKAIWTVIVPPKKLREPPVGGLWHLYPLEDSFKAGILDTLTSMS